MEEIAISIHSRIEHLALDQMLEEKGYSIVPYAQKEQSDILSGGLPVYNVSPEDVVAVFIGSTMATAVINSIITDIYSAAKEWARNRFSKKPESDSGLLRVRITIYGPSGDKLSSLDLIDEVHNRNTEIAPELAITLGKTSIVDILMEEHERATIRDENGDHNAKPQIDGDALE
jgi:hypothetical protein